MRIKGTKAIILLLLLVAPARLQAQDPTLGGVPAGQPTAAVLPLSLADAIQRGLNYNLAALLGKEGIRSAQGALGLLQSQILPNLSAGLFESDKQVNLKAFGFGSFPGVPYMVGPFGVFDSRLVLSQSIIDFKAINNIRAGRERVDAAEHAYQSVRDRVAFVCADLYLQAIAGKNRIDAAKIQLSTAQTLYELALDRKSAGVVPAIEVLRAQVELQSQQQRMIVTENEFEKEKLSVARAIGLPLGQKFELTEELPYVALPAMNLEETIQRALRDRTDYQSAQAQVRSAEYSLKAARSEKLPTLRGAADYGVTGPSPAESHGTFSVAASLQIPIFDGGRTQAMVLAADSELKQRQAELENLRGRIYYEVQTAFLNLQAADQSVKVADSTVRLAREQLDQARDRFSAGVGSNIEVVQAQEALATATEAYISSLYAHQSTKGRLAQILGAAESSLLQFLRGN
jgi:outer membrane protein TolC